MIAGCYTLDLYCSKFKQHDTIHVWNEFPHQYTDEFGSACRKAARLDGWVFKRNGVVLCPKCRGHR